MLILSFIKGSIIKVGPLTFCGVKKNSSDLFFSSDNVFAVQIHINSIIDELEKKEREIKIKNFGLDLETIIPWISYSLGDRKGDTKFSYKGLLIDSESELIKPLIDGKSNIKSDSAKSSENKLTELVAKFDSAQRLKISVRKYSLPPMIHGFLINDTHLWIGFTAMSDGKLNGGAFPYQYFKYNSKNNLNKHYLSMYESWFDYLWEKGENVIKI